MHGPRASTALQLREPSMHIHKRDGVFTPERMLLQTPAVPGSAGPHGHHGEPGPVPADVPSGVRERSLHGRPFSVSDGVETSRKKTWSAFFCFKVV